ncbi:MAG: 2-amino-4-hydroxy-6-hydroxymethyldihydropteridine diphosphokinase [Myxococcaceae bacterium]
MRASASFRTPSSPVEAFVALGTNVGDRLLNLGEARRRLARLGTLRRGPVVETAAVLPPGDRTPQPPYLNAVDGLQTWLSPEALHAALKGIERAMGRAPSTRWAPRVIDLDLVLHGSAVRDTSTLVVPHPRMHQRVFVLGPLVALAPGAMHPVLGRTARELLAELETKAPSPLERGEGRGEGLEGDSSR